LNFVVLIWDQHIEIYYRSEVTLTVQTSRWLVLSEQLDYRAAE
jgi:hypothetical protein